MTVRELLKAIADEIRSPEDLDADVEIETMEGGFSATRVQLSAGTLVIDTF